MCTEKYLNPSQLACLNELISTGEEAQHYIDFLQLLKQKIKTIPRLYESEAQGMSACIYLHYFNSYSDIYITELTTDRAFGYADLGGEGELGYFYLSEVVGNNYELDLYWDSTTRLSDVVG